MEGIFDYKNGPTFDDLLDHIGNDEVLLAALTNSIHRFFYDKCFSPYTERPYQSEVVSIINDLHSILWCKSGGFRAILTDIAKRYRAEDKVNWLSIDTLNPLPSRDEDK